MRRGVVSTSGPVAWMRLIRCNIAAAGAAHTTALQSWLAESLRARRISAAMAAQSLNCPNCGAAASSDSTKCDHCNSILATVACPSCYGMIFVGAKFCSHCGVKVSRTEGVLDSERPCPRCKTGTRAIVIGQTDLRECPRCEGLWADTESLQQICTDREQQAALREWT